VKEKVKIDDEEKLETSELPGKNNLIPQWHCTWL